MLGILFVYPLFIGSCVAGLVRPFWGLVGFYAFVFLEPQWNWRWSIPADANFQKYIAACLLVGFALSGMKGNKLNGWLGSSVFCLLLFLLFAYVSAARSIAPAASSFYLTTITKVVVVGVVAIKVIDTPRKAWMMLWLFVIAQGYNAFRINEQYFADGFSLYAMRAWGYKGDNNLYSIFTVPAIAAAFALAVYSEKKWQRLLAGGILLLQLHQLMLMESRGTMIGVLVLIAFGVFMMPKNRFTISATVVGAIITAVLAGPPVVNEFLSAFKPAEERDSSAESRFKIWKAGVAITLDHPVLGVGPYAGQALVPRYEPAFANRKNKGLHNLLFEISTGCGIPATALYFGFFLLPWYKITKFYWHARDQLSPEIGPLCLALVCGIPGYLCASMFSSGALLESPYALTATCAGGVWAWLHGGAAGTAVDDVDNGEPNTLLGPEDGDAGTPVFDSFVAGGVG